jgi:pyruvate ferredoxin oxidoreductase alpha subunit
VEHNDALAVRDLGWHLYWVATAQEALDMALIAYKVAEDPRVLLPFALSCDGSFLTHSQAIVQVPSRDQVEKFLPPYKRGKLQLHPDNPITVAPQVNEDWLMEIRKQTDEAMRRTPEVIKEAYEEFREIFGRGDPSPFIEEYMCEDAEIIVVGMGTLAMPTRVAIRRMREAGKKVGFLRVKFFRPFPAEELQKALGNAKGVAVIDRDYSYGSPSYGGVLFHELRSTMYPMDKRPLMLNFIAGLGGREVMVGDIEQIVETTQTAVDTGKIEQETTWVAVRE